MVRPLPTLTALMLVAALHLLAAGPALAQAPPPASPVPAWARFEVPDSLLKAAVFASANEFEATWNVLLVTELRAISGSKNALVTEQAAHLLTLARKVARAETDTLGTHIGDDALVLYFRWLPAERDLRVDAAMAESVAVAAQGLRQLDRSDSQFRAALALYRRLGERRREAWVVGSLGVVAFAHGDFVAADSIYREALLLRLRLADARMIGNTLNALGITSQQLRWSALAHSYFQQARAVRESLPDRSALASTLRLLGTTAAELGEPDSARIAYGRALELAMAVGDSARTAEVLIASGSLSVASGKYAAAVALFARAGAIAIERGDLRLQSAVERSVADMRRRQGRFAEAADGLRRAIALDERLGDGPGLALDLISLGRVAVNERDPAAGRAALERGLAVADSLRSPGLRAQALNNLAALTRLEGDARGAERLGARALAQATLAGDSVLVHDTATTLGQQAVDAGDFKAARAWFERALAAGVTLPEEQRSSDHHNLGTVAAHGGRLDVAEREFHTALDLADRSGLPDFA